MIAATEVPQNLASVVPGLAFRLGYVPLASERAIVVPGARGVAIDPRAMATLRRWRQAEGDPEACGVLTGRETLDGGVVIDAASEPGPADIRRTRFCRRIDPCHQQFVIDEWARDNGITNYVGSWHTHSEPIPNPSILDIQGWLADVADMATQMRPGDYPRRLVYVIVGQSDVGVWEVPKCPSF